MKHDLDGTSTTGSEDSAQSRPKPSLYSASPKGSLASFRPSFDLPPLHASTTGQSQPSWRRRTMQREQYLVGSMSRSALRSPVTPQSQPHFILDQIPQVLAHQSISDTTSLNTQSYSSPSTARGTASPNTRKDSSASFSSIRYSAPRLDSDTSGLAFTTEGGDAASFFSRSSATCDSTGGVTHDTMLSPNALFTANINVQRSPARATAHQTAKKPHAKKSKGSGMLSAWNRKKNKDLPVNEESTASLLTAAQSPQSQMTTSTGSSSNAFSFRSPQLDPFDDNRKSSNSSRSSRLLARSGKAEEAENIGELCEFLNERRIEPSDAAHDINMEPKSTFEWDSEEDDKGTKVRKVSIPRLKKHIKAAAAGKSDTEILQVHEEVAKAGKVMKQLEVMFSPQTPGGSRANAFKEQPELLDVAAPRREIPNGRGKATHVTLAPPAQIPAFSRKTAVNRSSVLKLFNDPIWGGDSVTEYDFREREFSNLRLGADAYNRAKARARLSRLSTSNSMPSLTASPKRKVRQTTFDDLEVSRNGNQRGGTPELSPSPPMARISGNGSIGKPIGPKKFKSQAAAKQPPPVPRRDMNHGLPSPSFYRMDAGCHTPNTSSRPRHGVDVREEPSSNSFKDHASSPIEPRSSTSGESNIAADYDGSLEKSRTVSGPTLPMSPSSGSFPCSTVLPTTPSQKPKKLEKLKKPKLEEANVDHSVAEKSRRSTGLRLPALEQKRLNRIKAEKETVQSATTAAQKEGKILGSLFKKSRSPHQDAENQGNAMRQHVSEDEAVPPSVEPRDQFWEVFKRLTDDKGAASASAELPKTNDSAAPVGLGIIDACGNASEQVLSIPQASELPGGTAVIRAMSTITEADVESVTQLRHTGDDASSVYSGYSLDALIGSPDDDQATEIHDDSVSPILPAFVCDEAIPEPLKVQKRRPPPLALDIPVLKVDRSSKDVQLETSPTSFSPRRDSTFMRKIEEARRAQLAKLWTHPAMRDADTEGRSPTEDRTRSRSGSAPKLARIDSGMGMDVSEFQDEGYGSGNVDQWEWATRSISNGTVAEPLTSNSLHQRTSGTSANFKYNKSRLSGKVDMQKLRTDMDLEPLQLPVGDSPRHPHHPFTWDHEKVMCRMMHNRRDVQPQLPEVFNNHPINLRHVKSVYFDKSDPTIDDTENVKECSICGKLCCRYAELLVASKTTSKDIGETAARLKANNRVNLLRGAHPNGIEEYETVMDCGQCGRKVCPGCANRCKNDLCKDVCCFECGQGLDSCPVHNFF